MKRKHIALVALITLVISIVLKHFSHTKTISPNNYFEKSLESALLIIEIILMRIVYVTKDNETKNIGAGMNVVITLIYLLFFSFLLITG